MKKKLLLMAIALIGLTGITAQAQETQNNNNRQEAPAPQNKMRQPREFTEFAFEGILLDLNQQQRMDSLNAAVKANCPSRPDRACCANDGADCKKAECNKADCKKAECKKAECNKAECNKAECKKAECKKAECNKAECKKAECKKAECNKADCKQGQCPKTESCEKDKKNCENAQCGNEANCNNMKRADGEHRGKGPKGNGMRMGNPYGEEYVAKVKEILTPDQFVIFQENISKMPMNMKRANAAPMMNGVRSANVEKNKQMKVEKKKAAKIIDKKSKKETK